MLGRSRREGSGLRCGVCGATLSGPAIESLGAYFCLSHPSTGEDQAGHPGGAAESPPVPDATSPAPAGARAEALAYAVVRSAGAQDRGFHREDVDDYVAAWEPLTPKDRLALGEAFTGADEANLARGNVYVITDGGEAAPNGVLASRQAAEALVAGYVGSGEPDPAAALASALVEANRSLYEGGPDGPGTMATSCVCVVVRGPEIYVGHLGPSRAYLLRRGRLTRLTDAHGSGVRAKGGRVREDHRAFKGAGIAAGNETVRLLGAEAALVPWGFVQGPIPTEVGDRLLLCTDGLWGPLGERTVETLLGLAGDVAECAGRLSQAALLNNGADNATALVAEVEALDVHARLLPLPVFPDWLADWGAESELATGQESTQGSEGEAPAVSTAVEDAGVEGWTETSLEATHEGPAALAEPADRVVDASAEDEAEANRGPETGQEADATGVDVADEITPTIVATLARTRRRGGWRRRVVGVMLVVLLVAGAFFLGRITVGALAVPSTAGTPLERASLPGGSTPAPAAGATEQSGGAGRAGASQAQATGTPAADPPAEPPAVLPPGASPESPVLISSPEPPAALPPSPTPEPTAAPLPTATPQPTATAVRTATPPPALSPAAGAPATSTPSRTEPQASCFLRVEQPGFGPFPPGIRLRAGPSPESGDLGAIPDGAQLEWTRQRSPGSDPEGPVDWYEVRLGTRSGWVSSRYLRPVGC